MGILFGVTLKFQISSILEECISMLDIFHSFWVCVCVCFGGGQLVYIVSP